MNTVNVGLPAKFEFRSFTPVTRSWDNSEEEILFWSDWSFGWGLRTPNLGEEEAVVDRGMEPFERALLNSYRHSI